MQRRIKAEHLLKNFDKAGKRNHLVGNCDTGIIIALDISPNTNGVRYSVYSDTASFMEIEAVGGCPATIMTDAEMKVQVATQNLINILKHQFWNRFLE